MTTDPRTISLQAGNTAFITGVANSDVIQRAFFTVTDDLGNSTTSYLEGGGSRSKMISFNGTEFLNLGPFTNDHDITITLKYQVSIISYANSKMLTAGTTASQQTVNGHVGYIPNSPIAAVNIRTDTILAQNQQVLNQDDCIATIIQTKVVQPQAPPSAAPATSAETESSA